MDVGAFARRLAGLRSGEDVVTVTLDVADSGILPPATRIFLKDRVYPALPSDALRARLRRFLADRIRPETNGVFIAAGPGLWEVAELLAPLDNFVRAGRAPYLPPLVEALERWPRVYVLRYTAREGRLQEFRLGEWKEIELFRRAGLDVVPRDPERRLQGPPVLFHPRPRMAGSGGGERERYEDTVEDASAGMLEAAARRVAALHARAPAAWVFAFGDKELYPYFRDRLPAGLAERTRFVGPVLPPREDVRFRRTAARELRHLYDEKTEAEVREFRDRRAQGWRAALGPGDVLGHAESGRLSRVYLDPLDPVEWAACPSCGLRPPTTRESCAACGVPLSRVSLAGALVARSLTHPPLPLTFVRKSPAWLRELGGLAGLLSTKGLRRKRG